MEASMPRIRADFCLTGSVGYDFDPAEITKALGITPSRERTLDDWPEAIRHPKKELPEGIGAAVSWEVSTEKETSWAVSNQFDELIDKLKGKEEAINKLRSKHDLKAGFNISLNMTLPDGPELFLDKDITIFIASIGASVGFDYYIDPFSYDIADKYLPIGSVVRLKNGSKLLMIFGRAQIDTAKGEVFDYAGCLYPEGNISDKHSFLFNHEDIEELRYRGYDDNDEEEELNARLREHYQQD